MTSEIPTGTTRKLVWAEYPDGTSLSQSSRTPGAYSALARNDDNELETHAELRPAATAVAVGASVAVTAAFALGVVAAPHLKNGFSALKSRLRRTSQDTAEATVQGVQSDSEPEIRESAQVPAALQPFGASDE